MKTSDYTKCVPVMNTNVFGSFFVLNYKFNTDFFFNTITKRNDPY